MRKNNILIFFIIFLQISACSKQKFKDVSSYPEFKDKIGLQYKVIGNLDAYGIREHSKSEVEYITLIPPPGIAGSEVGFEIPVAEGAKVAIVKALKSNRMFVSNITFIVFIEGMDFPKNILVRIDLFRGNEGEKEGDLNKKIYQKQDKK